MLVWIQLIDFARQIASVRIGVSAAFALSALLVAASCSSEKVNRENSIPFQESSEGRLVESFWSNGNLLQRAYVVDGKYEGVVEQWWEDGTLVSRKKFRHSVLIDTAMFWHLNGQVSEMIILEDGISVSDQSWNANGTMRFQSIRIRDSTYHDLRWNEKGQIIEDRMQVYPKKKLQQYPDKNG